MAEELPYADDLFPAKAGEVPYADDLFPASVDAARERRALGASPLQDYIFSRDSVSAARVLNHFGQGVADTWGASGGFSLTKETAEYMRKSGWAGDYETGQATIAKAANEALFRPAAVAIVGAGEGLFKGIGSVVGGLQRAIAETGTDLGQKQLGRDLAATFEALPTGTMAFGVPRATPLGSRTAQSGETLLLRARAAKVIGHGEEGWKGATPETAASKAAERAAPVEMPADGMSPVEQIFAAAPEAAPTADVHTAARGIAPDLFYRYDEIQTERQTLSAIGGCPALMTSTMMPPPALSAASSLGLGRHTDRQPMLTLTPSLG